MEQMFQQQGKPPPFFLGQQTRPLNLPFGMLLPPTYVGYRPLGSSTSVNNFSTRPSINTTI
jgi:hypothetical protein